MQPDHLNTLVRIIDGWAILPDDVSDMARLCFNMLYSTFGKSDILGFPTDDRETEEQDQLAWHKVGEFIVGLCPEAGTFPTYADTKQAAMLDLLRGGELEVCIRSVQQSFVTTLMEALRTTSRKWQEPEVEWFDEIPQHPSLPLDAKLKRGLLDNGWNLLNQITTRALAALDPHDLAGLKEVMTFFLELVYDACHFVENSGFDPDEETFDKFFKFSVNTRVGFWMTSPYEVSNAARNALMTLNKHTELVFRALVQCAMEIYEELPDNGPPSPRVRYFLSYTVIEGASLLWPHQTNTMQDWLRSNRYQYGYTLLHLVRGTRGPNDHREMARFLEENFNKVYQTPEFEWEVEDEEPAPVQQDPDHVFDVEYAPPDMEDVGREPVGPERSADLCSISVPVAGHENEVCAVCRETFEALAPSGVVQQANCSGQHLFHRQCLETVINGISRFSNTCPNCRAVLCALRPSRPVLNQNVHGRRIM